MRRSIGLGIIFVVVAALAVWAFGFTSRGSSLNVLNWDFYIGSNTLREFQAKHDAGVNYTIYASNEDARDRIRAAPGRYDIVFPSDYMMDYFIRNNMLEPLPENAIENNNPSVLEASALREFRERGWDRYCVPYLFGNAGFAVNSQRLNRDPRDVGWRWLASQEFSGRVLVLDDARQVLGSVLIELGHDPNSTDANALREAVNLLRSLRPKIVEFTSDTGKERMLEGTADVAFAWSGDSLQVQAARPHWRYSVPSFGGIRFQDGICIPRSPPHREMALTFINFLLDPRVHLGIISTTHYPTTNRAARELAPARLRQILGSASGPGLRMHQLRDLDDDELRRVEAAWSRVKAP